MHVPHRFSGIGTRRRCSAAPLATPDPLLSLAPGPLLSLAPDPLLSRPGHPAKPLEP
jgi:hypothetical protein